MASMDNKYLVLARRAREEDNTEDARKYYDMVRTDDPENVEARFFYAYYRLWDGTKGEAFGDFMTFCKAFPSCMKAVISSEESKEEKEKLLSDIYDSINGLMMSMRGIQLDLFKSAPDSQQSQYNDQKKKCEKNGIEILYVFGDCIEQNFSDSDVSMKLAVSAWKKGVGLQQQYPYCGLDKKLPETYAAKIQKFDPSFALPKKAGCISF